MLWKRPSKSNHSLKTVKCYDSLGNLVFEKTANQSIEYFHNSLNQLIEKQIGGQNAYAYTFDKRGNLLKGLDSRNTVVEEYLYKATNRMVKGVNEAGEESSYIYNGLGYLIAKELFTNDNGGTRVVRKDYTIDYISPFRDVIMVKEWESGSSELNYRYTYGLTKNSVVVTPVEGGEIKLYYHMDRLGFSRFLTDNAGGGVVSRADYDEWGGTINVALLAVGGAPH